MMADVGIGDVVEDMVEDAIVSIDGGQSSSNEGPVISSVMGDIDVSVLEICDGDQPKVDKTCKGCRST